MYLSLVGAGWGCGTGLLQDMEGRQPLPAWASWKPSAPIKAQHIQGPRARLQGKTGNTNTGCVLVCPQRHVRNKEHFPMVPSSCLQEQSTQAEGCEPSLSHRFGPPGCVLDVSVCVLIREPGQDEEMHRTPCLM